MGILAGVMRLAFALAALLATTAVPVRASDWPVFGHDPARSGYDASDPVLSARNVGRLRARWRTLLGDVADSTPIFLSRIGAPGRPTAMLFQTAKDGTTYGIDAYHGRILWRFTTHGPKITSSTPAADPSEHSLYVPGVDGFVHELDPATGRELSRAGFPVRITWLPETEKDASALNLADGYLYAVTSGYFGDARPYVGHVVTVRLSDGSTQIFNTLCSADRSLPTSRSCSQNRSGIWARAGAVVELDPSLGGRVYVATGNGDFDASAGGQDYGDSVLALNRDGGRLWASYTPTDYADLEAGDTDLGSTAPALLPREPRSRTPLMAVQGGKDEILRLLDRAHLPGVGGELQRLDLGDRLFSAPAVWPDEKGRTWIFVGLADALQAYRLMTSADGESRLVRAWSVSSGGTSPVVSNGIVFAATSGAINAYDAQTGLELWSSAHRSAGHSIGGIHWQSPIVVNGWVYCSDEDGYINAYALPEER